jgi:hypothetical protein
MQAAVLNSLSFSLVWKLARLAVPSGLEFDALIEAGSQQCAYSRIDGWKAQSPGFLEEIACPPRCAAPTPRRSRNVKNASGRRNWPPFDSMCVPIMASWCTVSWGRHQIALGGCGRMLGRDLCPSTCSWRTGIWCLGIRPELYNRRPPLADLLVISDDHLCHSD